MAFQRRLANPTCTRPLAAIWRNSSFMKERRSETPPRISHTSNRHPPDAFAEFDILRKDNKLCDIILNVGGRRIFAHKLILCACSPYFKAMFLGELLESTQTEVNMKDIDEDALETIVDFCYTSSITVDENNVQTLLPAASLLQMTEVQNICCEFLQYQLDPSNCLGIRAFADIHSCSALRNIADKFIRANFKEVVACEEFLSLSADDLESIIAKDELNIFDEEQVFDAIILWAKHNAADRKQHLFKMLRHVRLHLINPKTLVKKVGNDTLVRTDESCRDLVEKAKNYHLLPDEKPTLQGPRIRPRVITRRDRRYQPKPYYSGGLVVY